MVEKERPDLEEQRRGLVQSHAALERQLAAAEERLLRLVSGASGTILDDAALEDALTAASGTYENIQVSGMHSFQIVSEGQADQLIPYWSLPHRDGHVLPAPFVRTGRWGLSSHLDVVRVFELTG